MKNAVEILHIIPDTPDVRRYRVEKPDSYKFTPGQATDVAIDRDGWREEERPFTFTSLPEEDTLEFTIKSYPDHDGVTDKLAELTAGDSLLIQDPWGTIEYKGPGVFIAGGAGITPFLAILRKLAKAGDLAGNRLIFGNKTGDDIIARTELEGMLTGEDLLLVLSDEEKDGFRHGLIDKELLSSTVSDFNQRFYVCGPPPMMDGVTSALKELGADPDALTFED
ncbi:MAG: flavodoxin reductase [Anderseniella sp.]|nr:flavodoxin reductase [Anderseniella sp.]